MVLSEHFDKRLASLHFSAMRVTNATTFRASTRSTSHTTIVVLNIFDPSTLQLPPAQQPTREIESGIDMG
jgi:hypothetical protein